MAYENFKPVVEVTRGNIVESVHFGAVAVVEAGGRLVASYGNPETVAYLRSSAKPFQALPFIEMGGAEKFGLSEQEIAILCASHSGTDEHVQVLSRIMQKTGLQESDLKCGSMPPLHQPTWLELVRRGEEPTPIRHMCSGKHTGMLAQARLRGLELEDYLNPQHPVQQADLMAFCELCDIDSAEVALGIDGCSAPVFAVPLYHTALGYANLVNPVGQPSTRAEACNKIAHAMMSYPEMVSGPGRFDTLLMQVGNGKIVAKGGAEGFQGIGLLPGATGTGSPGLGIAIKISDGDSADRAVSITTLEVLNQLGTLDKQQLESLQSFYIRPVKNWRKLDVGQIRPILKLVFHT